MPDTEKVKADIILVDCRSLVFMAAQIAFMDKMYTAAYRGFVSYRKLFSVTQHEKSRAQPKPFLVIQPNFRRLKNFQSCLECV